MESPIVFEQAVWAAFNQGFVDFDNAVKAISDYELDYATMHRKDHSSDEHKKVWV
jgi:hypothetical protein